MHKVMNVEEVNKAKAPAPSPKRALREQVRKCAAGGMISQIYHTEFVAIYAKTDAY